MKISVIIPTYNGAHKIMGVLRSLHNQQLMADEVIVVVDGSTDGTVEVLKKENLYLNNFKIIEQPNGGRAQVRNTGAQAATGDLLIFFDDDMILPNNSVFSHHQHHLQFSNCLMSGRLKDPNENSEDDFQQYRAWLNRRWEKMNSLHSQVEIKRLSDPYLTANNFSVPAVLFSQLGGFDIRLRDAEDFELAARAIAKDIPVYLNPNAIAWHNDLVNCKNYIKRQRQYLDAHLQLASVNSDLKTYSTNKKSRPMGLKGAIFYFFASKFWIECVERKKLNWLPKVIRFKIYDVVITANGSFFPEKVKL